MNASRSIQALMLAAGVAISAPACAAHVYGYRYPGPGNYERELERRGYDNGFREGLEEGRNDARHHRSFSFDRHSEYRDADGGYHRSDGDVNFYRRSYRRGSEAGYNEAFNRYARGDYR
jgi:hypothetical protein